MAAELDLDPLPATEWVHGVVFGDADGEAPTDGTIASGDTRFMLLEPLTYTVAQVIEEMIDALQTRRNHIQLPRWSFAFGIGTGSAAGKLKGLADNGLEEFPNGFVARPVIHTPIPGGGIGRSDAYYLARCLKRDGTFTGTEDEVYGVWVGGTGWGWGWYWPDPFVAWVDFFYDDFPWYPREMNHGITIQCIKSAGVNYIMKDAFMNVGTLWVIKAYKTLRRTDHAIAYVLMTQLMDALEETLLGSDDAMIDFGDGLTEAAIQWKDPDYSEYESGKFLIYDTDVENIGGFESIPLYGSTTYPHDGLKKGMEGAIMQCRGMLNDLRWATAMEKTLTSDPGVSVWARTLAETIPRLAWSEYIGTSVEASVPWPATVRGSSSAREYHFVQGPSPRVAVGLSVRKLPLSPPLDVLNYFVVFAEDSAARVLRFSHGDETEAKVVHLRVHRSVGSQNGVMHFYGADYPHRLRDNAGDRAYLRMGVYKDVGGALKALYEAYPPVLEDPQQTSWDDFRAGGQLTENDLEGLGWLEQENITIVLPKREIGGPLVERYIALVGEVINSGDNWNEWVPETGIPPLVASSLNNLEATTGRGYNTVGYMWLEMI